MLILYKNNQEVYNDLLNGEVLTFLSENKEPFILTTVKYNGSIYIALMADTFACVLTKSRVFNFHELKSMRPYREMINSNLAENPDYNVIGIYNQMEQIKKQLIVQLKGGVDKHQNVLKYVDHDCKPNHKMN